MMGRRYDALRQSLDTFYFTNGPCCAGCDWWSALNSVAGECMKSAPMSGRDRLVMAGMEKCTLMIGGGHAVTVRGHHCGEFKDDFDWSSLPITYLKAIGYNSTRDTAR
jgi:hypothetical protein